MIFRIGYRLGITLTVNAHERGRNYSQMRESCRSSVDFNLRFSVGKNGEIRFLEIEGSSNPQIRECIRKAFARAFPSRFQRPPNGDAFTGRLDGIEFLAQ